LKLLTKESRVKNRRAFESPSAPSSSLIRESWSGGVFCGL